MGINILDIYSANTWSIAWDEDAQADLKILGVTVRGASADSIVNIKRHNHNYFEVHYVGKGSVVYEVENVKYTLQKGQFIIIPARCFHRVITVSSDWVKFSFNFQIENSSCIYEIFNNSEAMVYIITPEMKTNIVYIKDMVSGKRKFRELIVKSRLCEMVYLMAGFVGKSSDIKETDNSIDSRVMKAKRYVKDNPHIFFTCKDLAGYVGVCERTLSRLFIKYTNQTVLEYIHLQKNNEIRKRLLNSNDTQWAIANDLGFVDVQYFSRYFMKHFGKTPNKFRNQFRDMKGSN